MWKPFRFSKTSKIPQEAPGLLRISSYNILVDSVSIPPDRTSVLLKNILSDSAIADILILQEVCDDFLSTLLKSDDIRRLYPFTTHGPPDQLDVGPLLSLRNIIILSRFAFDWEWLPFKERHKGAAILKMTAFSNGEEHKTLPTVISGVHLSAGLSDESMQTKKSQYQKLLNHLCQNCPENPWIIAGDFNLTTSSSTIDEALRNKLISHNAVDSITSIENLVSEVGLSDCWVVTASKPLQDRMTFNDIYEGEDGATFDPTINLLAAKSVRNGPDNRPQRYDRVLIMGRDHLNAIDFNMFGFPEGMTTESQDLDSQTPPIETVYGSDHWGIRATLQVGRKAQSENQPVTHAIDLPSFQLQLNKAPMSLSNFEDLKACLLTCHIIPTDQETQERHEIFSVIEKVLVSGICGSSNELSDVKKDMISLVVSPVGSYGLGVWNSNSDIDCCCVGSIGPKDFFSLAERKLKQAAHLGVKVLRKVDAASGTMLELEVRGVKADLQYCRAPNLVSRWNEIRQLSPSDPVFDLPIQSLAKLKSFRDLNYHLKSIPDLGTFRTAYRFIVAWAKARGIYSAKFGYLAGVNISLLLSRVCKLVSVQSKTAPVTDIITTFFDHYATFDWSSDMVYDPFFHGQHPKYHRSAREPMVVLGYYAPNSNKASTACVSSVRTLIQEFKRANILLSRPGITWTKLLGQQDEKTSQSRSTTEFLKSYHRYVKIDVQYWGSSSIEGNVLIGWLESKVLILLVDIGRKLPDLFARIWPVRFMSEEDASSQGDYQGCYLIGLGKWMSEESRATPNYDFSTAEGILQTSIQRFAERMRNDEKYFDTRTSWIDVCLADKQEIGNLMVDNRAWGV